MKAFFEITRPTTWPTTLSKVVAEIDARTPHSDHPSDLHVQSDAATGLWGVLRYQCLLARHFTRLLPHEFDSIRRDGLFVHERALFDRRIDAARAHGFFSTATAEHLKEISIPAAENGKRGRRNLVCLTVGPSHEEDPTSVKLLHSTWGGEGLYFARGARSPMYQELLRDMGQAVAVHVALRLADRSTLRFCPPLENLLLAAKRGLPHVIGDVCCDKPIPSASILHIEKLS